MLAPLTISSAIRNKKGINGAKFFILKIYGVLEYANINLELNIKCTYVKADYTDRTLRVKDDFRCRTYCSNEPPNSITSYYKLSCSFYTFD